MNQCSVPCKRKYNHDTLDTDIEVQYVYGIAQAPRSMGKEDMPYVHEVMAPFQFDGSILEQLEYELFHSSFSKLDLRDLMDLCRE